MRDFAKVSPLFWQGKTARKLRTAGPEALAVAMYLVTCPHSHFSGLYHIPLEYIALDMGMTVGDISELSQGDSSFTVPGHPLLTVVQAIRVCIEAGFCDYDAEEEVIWVYNMAFEQLGEGFKPQDKRQAWLLKEVAQLPNCRFLGDFYKKYASLYRLPIPEYLCCEEVPSMGHGSPFEAASEGERGGMQAPSMEHGSGIEGPFKGDGSPFEAPSKLKEKEREKEKDLSSSPPRQTVNQDRARDTRSGHGEDEEGDSCSPAREILKKEEPGGRGEAGEEFLQLRKFYDEHVKHEGETSGLNAYRQARASRDWPGVQNIMLDIRARVELRQWNPGYGPSMQTYLQERYYRGDLPPENLKARGGAFGKDIVPGDGKALETAAKMADVGQGVLAKRKQRALCGQ